MDAVTVVKLGGSLLRRIDLADRLAEFLVARERPLLVVGGGDPADVVRGWGRVHGLPDEVAHEVAIASLRLAAELVVRLVPRTTVVSTRLAADEVWAAEGVPVLDVGTFQSSEGPADDRLPATWDVTSDALAAWIALRWPASRLVILKSRPLPTDIDWTTAAALGLVDPWFPRIVEGMDVTWRTLPPSADRVDVNLRFDR